jgi:hypothetical protein
MELKAQTIRDGTSQRHRGLPALDPGYVAVDESTLADWIQFAQNFSQTLVYVNAQNQPDGNWSAFFAIDAQVVADTLQTLPALGTEGGAGAPPPAEKLLEELSQPHLALLFTFLKLLQHPQQQFQALTQRRLDFYYRQVLQLTEKAATPDRAHVVFTLADDQSEALLPQGTPLKAGTDALGNELTYALDQDLFLNRAQVASVKTLSVQKRSIDLESIHLAGDRTDEAFAAVLRWAVGSPNQGDPLPALPPGIPGATESSSLAGIIGLFQALDDLTPEAIEEEHPAAKQYILTDLYFATVEDFKLCLDAHTRQTGQVAADTEFTPPTDQEWRRIYPLIEKAYRKKINHDRRARLRQAHLGEEADDVNFLRLWRFALGEPDPGDRLPPFEAAREVDLTDLLALVTTGDANARSFVVNQLFLSVADFTKIMALQNRSVTDPEFTAAWDEAYRLLERAQTKKRAFTFPPIDRSEVQGVQAVTRAESEPGEPLELTRFHPFIATPDPSGADAQPLGLAVTSPVLHLAAGTRQITLVLACTAETFSLSTLQELLNRESDQQPFTVAVSTAAGWLPLSADPNHTHGLTLTVGDFRVSADETYANSLKIEFTLDDTQPAVRPLPADAGSFSISTPHPLIQIRLNRGVTAAGDPADFYKTLKGLCLEKVHLSVAVTGIQDLTLRNDISILSTKSPFQPFDLQPIAGDSFYFAHPEIVSKRLDRLTLNLEWMGLPRSFEEHYQAYADSGMLTPAIGNDSFTAKLAVLSRRTWHELAEQPLFSSQADGPLAASQTLAYDRTQLSQIPELPASEPLESPPPEDLFEHDRYFRLELAGTGFQHDLYPLVLNKVARAGDADFVKNNRGEDTETKINSLTVYPPYTPKVKTIALDYAASAEIMLTAEPAAEPAADSLDRLFHLHPFGHLDLRQTVDPTVTAADPRYFLLPQYDADGHLYLGLRHLQPLQQLTLLFQLISGSGNADLVNPPIAWSFLVRDRWQPFQPDEILSDSTNGLLDSGIVRLTLPAAATDQNQLMPGGLYWLRATVTANATAIPDMLDIRTQAVTATFVDQGNDPEHLSQPLAANTIGDFVERNPAVDAVAQPYSSFGGRRAETRHTFYTRVSERLRHKQRALTRWDYEHMVLEQFPQIYKAKCLTQAELLHTASAAQVTVVVIPNLANTAPFLPLEPKAPQFLLREIEAYLQAHTSPFVKVVVKNPRYEQIKYRVAVRFQAGVDQGYFLKQLNTELVQFLSPWAYEAESDIAFGSTIHSSEVVHFMEKRPYVDYIANLKLIEQVTALAGDRTRISPAFQVNPNNLAQVKQVDSILVSAPEHIIDLITTADYEEETFDGIDYMIVGLDFVVT